MTIALIEALRQTSQRNGWTQDDIAERLGVSQGYVSRILGGTNLPGAKLASRIEALVATREVDTDLESLGDRVMRAVRTSPDFRALVEAALALTNKNE